MIRAAQLQLLHNPQLLRTAVCVCVRQGSPAVRSSAPRRVCSAAAASDAAAAAQQQQQQQVGEQGACSSSSDSSMAVDITRSNFQAMLPAIQEAIDAAAFVAFDCEMTGLWTDTNQHAFLDDMQARFAKMAESSKAFVITQFGLSCFEACGPGAYSARTFNFYVFPRPHGSWNKRFLCDASSLTFLSQHGFDFNKCIGQGVPFMPVRQRDWQLQQVNRSSEPRGPPVPAKTPEDMAFVAELVQSVTAWLAGDSSGSSSSGGGGGDAAAAAGEAEQQQQQQQQQQASPDELALPPMNSYRRLLAYQELCKPQFGVEGHPGFWVRKLDDPRCLVLRRASAQQAEALEAAARAERIAAINEAAGFAAVWDMLRKSNKPAVGHNCFFDVAYSLYSFGDAYLPATWRDWKRMARAWLPGGLWDSKHIARQLPELFESNTSLGELYARLAGGGVQQQQELAPALQQLLAAAAAASGGAVPPQLPVVSHAPGFEKYRSLAPGEAAHEAGYDAYMTGAVFASLLPLVAGKVASDPSSSLARAHAAAQPQQAPAAPPAASQQPPLQEQAQPEQAQPEQQPEQQPGQQPEQQPQSSHAALMAYVQGLRGRLNLGYSDIPFAALNGDDPIPERPTVFHLSGLPPGYERELGRQLAAAGLGPVRLTPLDSISCLADFAPEAAPAVVETLAARALLDGSGLVATPWAEYALARYHRLLPADAAGGGETTDADDISPLSAAAGAPARAAKRPRVEEAEEPMDVEQAPTKSGMCRMM